MIRWPLLALAVLLALAAFPADLLAHGVAAGDKGYLQEVAGVLLVPFAYLGAKHMVTGYDHLLFLVGVIFFLYRLRDIGLYVTLFAVGHSTTLLLGVLTGVSVSPYLIDAIIGLSVVYKALDNLGAFPAWFGFQPSPKAATLFFGFCHGFGLATKILDFDVSPEGLVPNLIAFNRRGGDRAAPGAQHHSDRDGLLAPLTRLRQTRLGGECGPDVGRLHPDGRSAHRVLPSRVIMTNPLPPARPVSTRKLLTSTLTALAVAGLLLLTVVLPAEYGIDPTGAGRVLGLTRMGEIKTRLAREAAADAAEDARAAAAEDSAAAADSVRAASPAPSDSTQTKGDPR